MKLLENTNIMLRALEPTDLDAIFKWENDTDIWKYGSTVAPYSKHQIIEYLKNYTADIFKDLQLRLMIIEKATNNQVGMIDLFDFNPFHSRAFIGILIDSQHQQKGYGYEAMISMINYAKDFIGLHQLAVNIPCDNTASIHLFKKLDFTETGRLKDWIRSGKTYRDTIVFQKIL